MLSGGKIKVEREQEKEMHRMRYDLKVSHKV